MIRVNGWVSEIGGCTYLFNRCDQEFTADPGLDAHFHVDAWATPFRLTGADPELGTTLIWACGTDGGVGAAVVQGSPTSCGKETLDIQVADATALDPTLTVDQRARVLEACAAVRARTPPAP